MSLRSDIDTMLFQLGVFEDASANRAVKAKARKVWEEWMTMNDTDKYVSEDKRIQLYRLLHATRGFDTGLRLFLENYNKVSPNSHSISDYVADLQRNHCAGFRQLNGNLSDQIKDEVTNKRNKYVHTSGNYPTKGETDFVISAILKYYTIVLGLAIR